MGGLINYSFIIPHKNTTELLQRCLNSIPCRDDVQVVIIDDNSDPEKTDFENFPGLNEPHIEVVFSKEGKGAGYARNIGLSKAVGQWIVFADADDFFMDGILEYFDKYKDSSYDLVYFGISRVVKKTKRKREQYREYDKRIRDAIYKNRHDEYKYTAYFPWGKLIRASLVKENGICFDEVMVANDIMFSLKTAYHSQNTCFDMDKIYTYMAEDSQLTGTKTVKANFNRFSVYIRMNCFFRSISKNKYKKNLVLPLRKLMNIHDMTYFYNGIRLMKENNFSIFAELCMFCLSMPRRIWGKMIGKIAVKSWA